MKQHSDIQNLLDRYWEGETTLEEERRLKAFFASENIPDAYLQVAPFFQALRKEQAVQMPPKPQVQLRPFRWYRLAAAVVVMLLSAGVWWWINQPEPTAAVAQVQPLEMEEQRTPVQQPLSVPAESMVADVVVTKPKTMMLSKIKTRKVRKKSAQPKAVQEDTYEDPEQALAEIKAVLALVSSKINRSKATLDRGLEEVNHVDVLLKKKKETSG